MHRERFWEHLELDELTAEEWEALCDGCGRCCLLKLQDEDTDELHYTCLSCRFLETGEAACTVYPDRFSNQPECLNVTPALVRQHADWLPSSCAYRRVAEGRGLADWHPLISGNVDSVRLAGISVANKVLSEDSVPEEDQQEFVVRWVD